MCCIFQSMESIYLVLTHVSANVKAGFSSISQVLHISRRVPRKRLILIHTLHALAGPEGSIKYVG